MAKSDEARGPVALWMRRERMARGWSTHDVVRELAARGHPITEPSYRGYEAGPRVSAPIRQALEAVFGSKPPDTKKEAAEPPQLDSLIAALEAQTAAINRLVDAMATDAAELPRQVLEMRAHVNQIRESLPQPNGELQSEGRNPQDTTADIGQ